MSTYTIDLTVERNGVELELTVKGLACRGTSPKWSHGRPEDYDPGADAEADILEIKLDGVKWDGELCKEEEDLALDRLCEAAVEDDGDDYEPEYDED